MMECGSNWIRESSLCFFMLCCSFFLFLFFPAIFFVLGCNNVDHDVACMYCMGSCKQLLLLVALRAFQELHPSARQVNPVCEASVFRERPWPEDITNRWTSGDRFRSVLALVEVLLTLVCCHVCDSTPDLSLSDSPALALV